jgi:DNA ligase D-like protein (predicted ligase)
LSEVLPTWIKPQLAALVKKPPEGDGWLHEIKFDGYRMHARLDHGRIKLLTRTGLDWTLKYGAVSGAFATLHADTAYLDGELCGVRPDGTTSFAIIQNASDGANAASLVFYLFDLLYLDGKSLLARPLIERKRQLQTLLSNASDRLHYSDHHVGQGSEFFELAGKLGVEGIVSKRVEGPYEPGRRTWMKTKCLNREEFVVVGWSDPEGTRHRIGALLLGYYTPDGKLIYAGRAGTGMPVAELDRLHQRLAPLAVDGMPLSEPPPRGGRFGSPLVLSRVHWVRPEMVAEVSYVEWTDDGLLRHVVYLGEREDKPAREVVRERP